MLLSEDTVSKTAAQEKGGRGGRGVGYWTTSVEQALSFPCSAVEEGGSQGWRATAVIH